MKIFYVHGWGSKFDPESVKVKHLSTIGEVRGIDVPWYKGFDHCITLLGDAILDYKPDLLVGTSMGGYAVSHLSGFGVPFVAINPAISPSKTLMNRVGEGIDYSGNPYSLTAKQVSLFPDFKTDGYGLLLVTLDDEVLDASETINKYMYKYQMKTYRNGGHRFTNLESALPDISAFYERSLYI